MKVKKLNVKGLIIIGVCITIALVIAVISLSFQKNKTNVSEIQKNAILEADNIEVTSEDLQEYRKNIGDSMDIKKSILLIFNTYEECQSFINNYGDADNPLSVGVGIAPQMDDDYYNVVGNSIFETIFDGLQDGEYKKEPIEFGGAFCYFKRLENYSVTDNDEDLKEFIKQEKSMERGGEINEENN